MLTVGSLVSDCGLELIAGAKESERPIRWVHISELEDPTPWLSGGELLLTTGIQLNSPARQRRFCARLAGKGVAGIGLGTGFEHKRVPKALIDEAAERAMPLFEVPYEMPFIAITERAFARLVNEQYAVVERGARVHEKLERLVVEGRGLDAVLDSLASAVGGTAIVQDAGGRELARQPAKGGPRPAAIKALGTEIAARQAAAALAAFEPHQDSLAGRALVVPVPGSRGGAAIAWLVVISRHGPLGDFERLTARQGAIVVGLELMRERVVRETERRLAQEGLPRSALCARGDVAGRWRCAGGRELRGSGRFHAAAVPSGRGCAAALQRRAAGTDRAHGGRVWGRAPAIARGLHRAQRQLGARRARALLSPPYAALPDPEDRGADRPRPVPGHGPDRAVARPAREGARRMRVSILGAGGTIAPAIVRDLAESDEAEELLLLDIDEKRAAAVADAHGAGKARATRVDARIEPEAEGSLARALIGSDVLINSASYRVNLDAMAACLRAGCHYLDLGGLYWMTELQLELDRQFERDGLLALLGMGSAPGK